MVEKKHFSYNIIILLIVLSLLLSGCIPLSDEAQITYLINRYYFALSKQNWDKARSYCLYNSDAYNDVTAIENNIAQWSLEVTLDYSFYIQDMVIAGKYATVNGILSYSITVNDDDEPSEEESGEKIINVEKIDNTWALY